MRKDIKFNWSVDCEKSFTEIKKLLCSQPVLEIFDKDLPIKIFTDASIEGMGAILKQTQHNREEKPVAYFSRKLNETQKKKGYLLRMPSNKRSDKILGILVNWNKI